MLPSYHSLSNLSCLGEVLLHKSQLCRIPHRLRWLVRVFLQSPQQKRCKHLGPRVIKDWDRTDRLSEIRVPTLILSGRYDESTPLINEVLHRGIAGSEWVIFE